MVNAVLPGAWDPIGERSRLILLARMLARKNENRLTCCKNIIQHRFERRPVTINFNSSARLPVLWPVLCPVCELVPTSEATVNERYSSGVGLSSQRPAVRKVQVQVQVEVATSCVKTLENLKRNEHLFCSVFQENIKRRLSFSLPSGVFVVISDF